MDYVVTVPKTFRYAGLKGLAAWIAEGDAAGAPESGTEYFFLSYGPIRHLEPGGRLYIVCEGKLRGYAPITRVAYDKARVLNGQAPVCFFRKGNAEAVTIPEPIKGFQGYRVRWWNYADERQFPDWMTP